MTSKDPHLIIVIIIFFKKTKKETLSAGTKLGKHSFIIQANSATDNPESSNNTKQREAVSQRHNL